MSHFITTINVLDSSLIKIGLKPKSYDYGYGFCFGFLVMLTHTPSSQRDQIVILSAVKPRFWILDQLVFQNRGFTVI